MYRTDEGKAATYYTPERTEFYKQLGGRWVSDGHEPAPHGISIVPMFNKARLVTGMGALIFRSSVRSLMLRPGL